MPSETTSPEPNDTQTRLLNAAEELMAQHGIAGVSLREITEAAGVNLALVKYHFGSKDGLTEAMLKRRLEPINGKRLLMLAEVEDQHPTGTLPLEPVLEALMWPAIEHGMKGAEGRRFLRLFGRIFAEPAAAMQVMRQQMGPMMKRFDAAFARALPQMKDADMGWRKMACHGAVVQSLLMLSMMDELPPYLRIPLKLIKGSPEPEKVLRQLVAFCAAGMRAEVPLG